MPNNDNKFINLSELEVVTEALLSKINEQADLKADKYSNISDFINDAGYVRPSDISYPVTSVNGQTGTVTITDSDEKVKYTDLNGANNGKGFLLTSILTSNGSSHTSTVYSTGKLQWNDYSGTLSIVLNTSSTKASRLSPYRLTLANNSHTYSGFLETSSSLSANRTYTLPNATGTIALTSDINYPVTSVNGHTGAVSLTIPTVPTNVSDFTNDAGYLTSYTETDPTVPAWAKAETKPTYTASEVGALPDTTVIPTVPQVVQNNIVTGQVMFQNAGDLAPKVNDGVGIGRGYINLGRNGESAATQGYISFINATYTGGQTLLKPTYSGTSSITVYLPTASGTLALEDKLKTTAGSNNTEYNLIGTATSNTNTSAVSIYNPGSISFAKTTTEGRLTLGNSSLPGKIRLYSNVTNATGYTDLISGTTSTNTRTITFPDATGTVALTTDIPSVPSWAMQSSKPSYAFSELTSHPTTINDYGITDAYTKTEVDGLVSGVLHYKGVKANTSALPSSGNSVGDVWHITADSSEWAWDGTEWQELGSTVDLTGYLQTGDIAAWAKASTKPSYTANEVGALSSNTSYVSTFNGQSGAITYIPPVTSVNGQTGAVTIGTGLDSATYVIEKNSTVNWVETVAAYNAGKLILLHYTYNDFNWYYPLSSIQIKSTTGTSTDDRLVFTFTGNIYNAMNIRTEDSTSNNQLFWVEQYVWQGGSTPKWTLINQGSNVAAVHLSYGSTITATSLKKIVRYWDNGTHNYFVYDDGDNNLSMYGILVAIDHSAANKTILKFVYTNDTTIITYTYDSSSSVNNGWSKSTATIPTANNETVCWVEIQGTVNWAKIAEAFNNNIPIMGYGGGNGGDTVLYELRDIKVTSATNPTSSDYITFGYVWGITSNYWTWQGNTNTWVQTRTILSESTHSHGYITNLGDITTNATIASGDRIVINDESASRIKNSSIIFGTSTTQYLANNGTWQNVPAAYDDTALAARVTALEQIPWVTYYTGSAEPSNSQGNNGDIYLQTETE